MFFFAYIFLMSLCSLHVLALPVPSEDTSKAHSDLANKLIFHNNIKLSTGFDEFTVTSKPLALRKRMGGKRRIKKPKKDSKIYYIPMPVVPYRFIPGHSIDYQPLIITPFLRKLSNSDLPSLHYLPVPKTTLKPEVKKQETTLAPNNNTLSVPTTKPSIDRNDKNSDDSKIHHMKNPLDTYKFNGRPFKVSVAHARPKDKVNAANLSSKFYYSKNIIY